MIHDLAALMRLRTWLERLLEGHGAKIEGSGCGLGGADVQILMRGVRYNVIITPLDPRENEP